MNKTVPKTAAILAAAVLCVVPAAADDTIALQNTHVRRVFELDGGVWRTTEIARADGTDKLKVQSDEFLIRMMDGTEFTVADFRVASAPVIRRTGDQQILTIRYLPKDGQPASAPKEVRVRYRLEDEPYLRKQILLVWPAEAAIDHLEVERFRTTAPCKLGGRGEPIFIGPDWFVGLEYPGAETTHDQGQVSLAHFPGLAKQAANGNYHKIESKTAVIGTGHPKDPIELAFTDYLDTIRHPSRILLHYNSWYDFRTTELTHDAMVNTFDAFKKNVLDPFDVKMDTFVPDDGWQDPQSIWVPRKELYPNGFGPLAKALESRGTRLGLWIPHNGFNLDADWGAKRGYEKSNEGRYYCLAGPKYNKAIRSVLERLISEGNMAYFKHDFNQLQCSAEGHGHLPDKKHGHEANLDALLDMLAFERSLKPDIYLNVTSYVWHSPWWLMHADTIWMAAGDFGYNNDWPQLSPREWAMSYRDAHFHKLYNERNTLVPLSAMMTHGVIHGRYQRLGGNEETLREWSDYVVMYYGRGVQLMEWYITPYLMSKERWEVLGRATRWALDNRDILDNVVRVGGDPRKGEAYGYAHWTGDRGLLVMRNPDLRPKKIDVPFDKSVGYRADRGKPFKGRVIYPHLERLPETFVSGKPIHLNIPPCSVMVYELGTDAAPAPSHRTPPAPPRASCSLVKEDSAVEKVVARIAVPDETMQRCDLYFTIRSPAKATGAVNITVDDIPASVRLGRGNDWTIYSVDLRSQKGHNASIEMTLGDRRAPFGRPPLSIDAWLVMDRPVEPSTPSSSDLLPIPIANNHRRQTVALLCDKKLEARNNRRPMTAKQLRDIKAAKLRIVVFDSNGGPRFADKSIHLNGQKLAQVPPNEEPLATWKPCVIDLAKDALGRIRPINHVVVTNAAGDYFKFSGLSLAVQLEDGSWVETHPDSDVHSSVARWSYAEGKSFTDKRSAEIMLSFE